MLYSTWTVGEKEYHLRLGAKALVDLERKLGKSPLMALNEMSSESQVPTLDIILDIIHAALQKYHHGIKIDDVYNIYDDYISEGHSFADVVQVLISCFRESGLVPKEAESPDDENSKN